MNTRYDGESKRLRVGVLTGIPTVDPRKAHDNVSLMVLSQVFETPYGMPSGSETVTPRLFEDGLRRESRNPDAYSAALRRHVVFSDGTPLTGQHVVDSLSRVEAIREKAQVEFRDDRVFFRLRRPDPRFDLALTINDCAIVLEKDGELLGTGPFVFHADSRPDALRLVRNERFRAEVPLDEICFDVYPPSEGGRPQRLLDALKNEQVDFTNMLSRSDVTEVHGYCKAFQPSNSTAVLYLNTESPYLADNAIRRAVVRAIDRRKVTEISYSNVLAFTASTILPPSMAKVRDKHKFDLDRAKEELATAGGPCQEPLVLLVIWAPRPYLPNPQPVAELIAQQLEELGLLIEVVQPATSGEYFDRIESGDYDFLLGGWIADTPDPAAFLEANLASDNILSPGFKGGGRCNLARWNNPVADRALHDFRLDPSSENRDHILRLVSEESPLIPLMYGPTLAVHSWKARNIESLGIGIPYFGATDLKSS